ncbi:hypothetical protein WK66_05695 [Burkholderia ubonensis]|nr:hypothetical protein WK66_05695 [Burkholderia ubonensis]
MPTRVRRARERHLFEEESGVLALLTAGGQLERMVAGSERSVSECAAAFRAAIESIVVRHVRPLWREACLAAYDTGMSAGLYGAQSSITAGLAACSRAATERAGAQGSPEQDLLELMTRFGERHGAWIRGLTLDARIQ